MKKSPYISHEEELMKSLVNAVSCFRQLKETHSSHEKDFIDGIHKCQNVIIHRIVQRDHPEDFPVTNI